MKKVIVYGTFDYFHYGHYNLFKQAKALGDYLIVGVSTDKFCREKKNKNCVLDQYKRAEIIRNIRFVNKVIFENNASQKIDDVKKYKIDIYVDGEDYKDIFPKTKEYKLIKQSGCKIVFLKRTPDVSSTAIKENLKKKVNE